MSKKNIQREQIKASVKELPDGWTVCQLGDVMRLKNGYAFKSKYYRPEGIPLVRISDINDGKVTLEKAEHIPEGKANIDFIIQPGDLLIAMSGATTGKTGIYNGSQPCLQNQRVGNFKIISEYTVNKKYRNYYVASLRKEIEKAAYGGAQPNISAKGIEAFDFPLAPLNEQKRIVAEIEKQFFHLDEAVKNLKRVKANLKRYKASVLKAAVEGKLTEEWRKKHLDVEPADKLLERILAERHKKWEGAELAKMKAKGKEPKDNKWKKKYKEPPQVDVTLLPVLPNGWTWANFERLAENIPNALKAGPFGSSLKKSFYVPYGYKIYGQEQVLRNDHTYGDYYIDEGRYEKLKNCAVKPGDILISLVGTIGKVFILPDEIEPGIINPRLVKFSLDRRIVDVNYIKIYLQSPYVKYLFSIASHGGTMDILNLTILKKIPIPVPPLEEQKKIVEELERVSSIEAHFSLVIDANDKRADRLRQSVLKNAFSGELIQSERS